MAAFRFRRAMSPCCKAQPLSRFIHRQALFARLSGVSLKFERRVATVCCSDQKKNDEAACETSRPYVGIASGTGFTCFRGGGSSRQLTQPVPIRRRAQLVTRPRPPHTPAIVSTNSLPLRHTSSSATVVNQINQIRHSSSSSASSILSKDAATASVDYPPSDRFWRLPPAIAIHLSIGSVYVYSMWTQPMSKTLGVVTEAPMDWTHSELLPVFSCAAVVLGTTTHFFGEWVERVGPRTAGMVGSACWSGALLTTAAGVESHVLPLVYLGYGALGGVGWGLLYLTPVYYCMDLTTKGFWLLGFPDRRGLATGIALSAFGAGAAIAPSLIHYLIDYFSVAPTFVGDCLLTGGDASRPLIELATLADGSQVVASASPIGEPGTPVVVATDADISRYAGNSSMGAGVYTVGSGDTGVSKALASLGVLYGVIGAIGSRFMKIPHPDWSPQQKPLDSKSPEVDESLATTETANIGLPASYVTTNTRQFPLLWMSVFGNATGGLALLSSSKLMLTDIFAGLAPDIVTPAFSTGYVSALGVGMALGRFSWSAASDVLGRQNTYALFGLGIPIVGMAPYLCHTVVDLTSGAGGGDANVWPYLLTFYSGSVLAITFYGGIFSVLPAYIADLFGQQHAGAIHGKALTAWASSAVCGPMGLAYLRSYSYDAALTDLLQTVETHDATSLEKSFGVASADDEAVRKLIDAKTITIEKLMELAPQGTVDPTPFLYDTTLYIAAGLMSLAALSNLAIRPLDLKAELQKVKQ